MKTFGVHPINRWLVSGRILVWMVVAGGVLWFLFGYLRLMTPLGIDAEWREELGYGPVYRSDLFLLYNLPGVLALSLTAWSALSCIRTLRPNRGLLMRASNLLLLLASAFGLLALVGQLIILDAITSGGLNMGTPILGLGLFLAGLAVIRDDRHAHGRQGAILILLGTIAVLTLPVRILMFALALLPLAFGVAVFALFAFGWIVLGFTLSREPVRDRSW